VTKDPPTPTVELPNLFSPDRLAEMQREDEQREARNRAERQAERMRIFPNRYRQWGLSDFTDNRREKAREFIHGNAWSMYLFGKVGCGKTCFAAAVGKAWIMERDSRVDFVPAYVAAQQLRNLGTLSATVNTWSTVPLLILDDIGANRATPHVMEQLLFIIQARYDAVLKTIITSNLDLAAFGKQIDRAGRAASRLSEGAILHMQGGDLRLERKRA